MRLSPREPFYLAANVINRDGTIEFDAEIPDSFTSIDDAVKHIEDSIESNGGVAYIFRCEPVKRVSAHRVQVEDFDDREEGLPTPEARDEVSRP